MENLQVNKAFQEWKDLGSITVYSEPNPWGRVYQRPGQLFIHENAHETLLLVYLEDNHKDTGYGFYLLEKGNFSIDGSSYNYRTVCRYSSWYLNLNL